MYTICKNNALTIATILALAVGVGLGFGTKHLQWKSATLGLVALPGELYMRMLKMVVLPLIFPKLILAVSALEKTKSSRKLGFLLISIYFVNNLVNECFSLFFCFTIRPGRSESSRHGKNTTTIEKSQNFPDQPENSIALIIIDLLKNMAPSNVVKAMIFQTKSVDENQTKTEPLTEHNVDATNTLGLVVFSIAFGLALRAGRHQNDTLKKFFEELSGAMTQILRWVIWFGPFGIVSMVWYQMLVMEDFYSTLSQLGLYVLTILLVLITHQGLVVPLVMYLVTGKNPYLFMYNMFEVIPTVIATASSLACFPITMRCLEEKNFTDPKITRFVLPIGVTIKMLPVTFVSILFLTQLEGELEDWGSILVMAFTLTLLAVGAAGIPQDNLILIFVAMSILEGSTENIVKVISIEWIMDRFGCFTKVMNDAMIVGMIDHLMKKEETEKTEEDTTKATVAADDLKFPKFS